MEVPESISKLTKEAVADPFVLKTTNVEVVPEDLVLNIKRTLESKGLLNFETGLAFYKSNTSDSRHIIKNIISLFSECYVKAINESEIADEFKENFVQASKAFFDGINLSFDAFYNILVNSNKGKNLLDINLFTLIILGYAINLIKKIRNS